MKKLFTLLALAAATAVMLPQTSEARGHYHKPRSYTYVSGYTSCGCPVYTKKVFCHYNRYGIAVYDYHRLPVNHQCHSRKHWNRNDRGHDHNDHYNRNDRDDRQYRYQRIQSRSDRH